jgi:hypothetical protein
MGDPVLLNCALEVCCSPAQAAERLAELFRSDAGLDAVSAKLAAACVQKHFDLAERGTLEPLKRSIAALARGTAAGV